MSMHIMTRGNAGADAMARDQQLHSDPPVSSSCPSGGWTDTEAWRHLRALLITIGFRHDDFVQHRDELHACLEEVIGSARSDHRAVETLLVGLKTLCADPQLSTTHRSEREWFTSSLVRQCIRRYYDSDS